MKKALALVLAVLMVGLMGINAFAKSSCVNANILKCQNPSGYHNSESEYCIMCGNCSKQHIET